MTLTQTNDDVFVLIKELKCWKGIDNVPVASSIKKNHNFQGINTFILTISDIAHKPKWFW